MASTFFRLGSSVRNGSGRRCFTCLALSSKVHKESIAWLSRKSSRHFVRRIRRSATGTDCCYSAPANHKSEKSYTHIRLFLLVRTETVGPASDFRCRCLLILPQAHSAIRTTVQALSNMVTSNEDLIARFWAIHVMLPDERNILKYACYSVSNLQRIFIETLAVYSPTPTKERSLPGWFLY